MAYRPLNGGAQYHLFLDAVMFYYLLLVFRCVKWVRFIGMPICPTPFWEIGPAENRGSLRRYHTAMVTK